MNMYIKEPDEMSDEDRFEEVAHLLAKACRTLAMSGTECSGTNQDGLSETKEKAEKEPETT